MAPEERLEDELAASLEEAAAAEEAQRQQQSPTKPFADTTAAQPQALPNPAPEPALGSEGLTVGSGMTSSAPEGEPFAIPSRALVPEPAVALPTSLPVAAAEIEQVIQAVPAPSQLLHSLSHKPCIKLAQLLRREAFEGPPRGQSSKHFLADLYSHPPCRIF